MTKEQFLSKMSKELECSYLINLSKNEYNYKLDLLKKEVLKEVNRLYLKYQDFIKLSNIKSLTIYIGKINKENIGGVDYFALESEMSLYSKNNFISIEIYSLIECNSIN